MVTGDSVREAYTAIAWGVGLSHERSDIAGAEGFHSLEGNMCGTAMRGAPRRRGIAEVTRWRLPDLRHARMLPPRLCGGQKPWKGRTLVASHDLNLQLTASFAAITEGSDRISWAIDGKTSPRSCVPRPPR